MRTAAPALLPFLRSDVQGGILAATYLSPEREFSVTELAAQLGASVKAVAKEVDRLVRSGLLADRRHGNMRLVRRGEAGVLTAPLTELMAVTYGPVPVLQEILSGVAGVDQAWVYGSWAARRRGELGPIPDDVDVIAVGRAGLDELDRAATAASDRLRREVNIRRVSPERWNDPDPEDPFLKTVKERPMTALELARPAVGEP
ncbi:MAG: winged helix-turn-helix domain-containing protein [Bifidobacteriaceae bacterium]|jgi:biotin operon repressor|nr:winged helix-turn-helix domain-containing protein [Bifidobacteriaceae bacterium]